MFALLAPLSGVVVPLDRVPDPVFMTLGSATSHAAILARALDIPVVTGIDSRALD